MSTDIEVGDFPKPSPAPRGKLTQAKKQKRLQNWEAAAIAYVQMENGEYRYPEGANRSFDSDGNPTINKRELMRRAGYGPGSLDHFDDYLSTQEEFWNLVELHRLRRTDPMFDRNNEKLLWQSIGGEALRNLYETVFYAPHSLTVEQHIKLVKLILDAGITLQKIGGDKPNRTAELLGKMTEEDRGKVMKGYKEKLLKDLEEVEAIEKADKALDYGE